MILSAAVDLVGSSTPKAAVLLSDILPAFLVKVSAPFYIHLIPYHVRIWTLVALSSLGMVVISESPILGWKLFGIGMASLSSGLGEITFLQLTHFYLETHSIAGFATGTGGAGLAGSFVFMLLTNVINLNVLTVLLLFAILPFGFIFGFFWLLPKPVLGEYLELHDEEGLDQHTDQDDEDEVHVSEQIVHPSKFQKGSLKSHFNETIAKIKPLFVPYMIPLCSVYISEYVINQGISPTLLFPLDELPSWLFLSYRDIYVVYGFLYQLGVFVSRSSIAYVRIKNLYLLSILQFINVVVTLSQSVFQFPFHRIWLLLILIFYEGLLGGFLYGNTFMSVSEEVIKLEREFSMGCVGISDSLGIVVAGCINWWLEGYLCSIQVGKGRDWCLGK